ncbi:hypothetical protein SAMN05216387_10915 [Nitrosovibrio tenuis]|uniref:Uncharacterized protein n=1 Tax=Nitrosovibrio tenuis TaxID=1233 RepID=A0A1H7PG19_9PROT|nr:hypothetical protein SAMN05216387_10915 [Nitrosovibrio tenuis]
MPLLPRLRYSLGKFRRYILQDHMKQSPRAISAPQRNDVKILFPSFRDDSVFPAPGWASPPNEIEVFGAEAFYRG